MAFSPPPKTSFDVSPSDAEIEFFQENGFLVVERLTSDEELAWIRSIFEHIFDPGQAAEPGAPIDRSGTLPEDAPSELSQAFFPELRFPDLLNTAHARNARRYAAALLGIGEERVSSWGHMIKKPPGGRAALWHQDHAYWQPELDYWALGVWLPLDDVSEDMGAMQFIPGSHKAGLLPHRHEDAPVENVLVVDLPVDTSAAVACPLPAGGATFHHFQTLHYTAPNTTDRQRLAYPVEFQIAPTHRAEPLDMPWVEERRAVVGDAPLTYIADGKVIEL